MSIRNNRIYIHPKAEKQIVVNDKSDMRNIALFLPYLQESYRIVEGENK